MNINKKQFTFHGYERVRERSDIKEKELNNLSFYAIKNGIDYNCIPAGPLKNYLWYRANKYNKRIKLYRGYVFIFFQNSRRLITCYPIPEKHLEEYREMVNNLKKKRRKKK